MVFGCCVLSPFFLVSSPFDLSPWLDWTLALRHDQEVGDGITIHMIDLFDSC